jgi:hypothetical protein
LRHIKAALVMTGVVVFAVLLAQPARADVSFDVAYSNLSDHGSWLVSTHYGRVWQPREYNRGWNPYSDGHWIYTDMGWAWVSDYEWGAVPYHYGTWVDDADAGWVWIPGRTWAPAWVVFRTTPEYIGWAPVPPGFSVGMSIDMGGPSSFVYVSSGDFLAPRLRASIIPMERARVFMNNTTVVNNIVIQNNVVINRGPDYRSIEKATGRTVHEERIENVARVAPFEHVTRAQLAVAPERVKQGVRVAEPVPASQPLPASTQHGRPSDHGQAPKPVAMAPHGSAQQDAAPQQHHANAPSDVAAQQQHAKTSSEAATQQQHAKTQSEAATQQQHAKTQSEAATQQQHAKAKSDPKAKKEQGSEKGTAEEPKKPPIQ